MAERRLHIGRGLHIGIDARELAGRPTGVGRYLSEVLNVWGSESFPHRLTLFMPSPAAAFGAALSPGFSTQILAADSAGTRWEQTRLPLAARRAGIDVLFAPAYTAPLLMPCPIVPAIHDLSYFAHPEWFTATEGRRRRWITWAGAKRAASIVTISEFSRGEIVRYLGVPASRIVLAPPGAPRVAAQGSVVEREPLVLFAGSLFNRRRIPELIAGFAAIGNRAPEARLVIVGDNRTTPRIDPRAIAARLGVGPRVTWFEYASDAELTALYRRASAFAFLSDYEGFAMTPLEAIAHGVPAVLSDTPVAREVYGGAAALVALDPESIAAALAPLLSDADAHRAAVAKGTARLSAFSWPRTAGVIRETLERAAGVRA